MDANNLNPTVLRDLLKLSEKKESLQMQLDAVNGEISGLLAGKKPAAAPAKPVKARRKAGRPARKPAKSAKPAKPAAPAKAPAAPAKAAAKPAAPAKPAAKPAKPAKPVKRGRHGGLKQKILGLLSESGPKGISVKEISEKLGVKSQNIHVWFSTTGKKIAEVTKIGEARFALKSAPAAA